MPKRPRPARPLPIVPGVAVAAAVAALALDDRVYGAVRRVVPLPRRAVLRNVVLGTMAGHVVEAGSVLRRARRADLGPAAPRWAASTLVWGVLTLVRFRRVVRAA